MVAPGPLAYLTIIRYIMDELLTEARIVPAVNQIEFSPYCYLPNVLDYCQQKNIQPEGYAPLVRGEKEKDPSSGGTGQ